MDSCPLIAITGQVPQAMIGRGAFQETDMIGLTLPIVKHSYLVTDINDIPAIVKEAFYIAQTGRPPLRRRAHGYAGLAAIIVSQQLSTASAGAIWGRLIAAIDPFEPAAILRARPARLARLGLSGAKIRALKAIARAIAKGEIVPATVMK